MVQRISTRCSNGAAPEGETMRPSDFVRRDGRSTRCGFVAPPRFAAAERGYHANSATLSELWRLILP